MRMKSSGMRTKTGQYCVGVSIARTERMSACLQSRQHLAGEDRSHKRKEEHWHGLRAPMSDRRCEHTTVSRTWKAISCTKLLLSRCELDRPVSCGLFSCAACDGAAFGVSGSLSLSLSGPSSPSRASSSSSSSPFSLDARRRVRCRALSEERRSVDVAFSLLERPCIERWEQRSPGASKSHRDESNRDAWRRAWRADGSERAPAAPRY
jgi:hypothetical protein